MGGSVGRPDAGGMDDAAGSYRERLHAPPWLFLLPLGLTVLVYADAYAVFQRSDQPALLPATLISLLVLALGVALFVLAGAAALTVRGQVLTSGRRSLPAAAVAGIQTLDRAGMHRALGREGDPRAFRVTRPWVRTGIYLTTSAGEGWLLSTRHPELLADALVRARTAALAS